MRLGLLDEDIELQNESDQLQMWTKELEKLKQDCFDCTRELEYNKIWRYKIEAQVDLLSKLSVQHSPTRDIYCTSNTAIDDENEQDKFISSSDKTPIKNGTSENVYFFGSNENSPDLHFTFSKTIPNASFNMPEKGCNKTQTLEKGHVKCNVFYNCSKNMDLLTSAIKKKKIIRKARRVLSRPNSQSADKEEINNKSSLVDSDKKSKHNSMPSTLKNDNILPDEQPVNENDWINKISLEINELKKSLSQLKNELKVNSKWRNSVEKKLNEITSTRQSHERNDETEFVKLNKKIDKHYMNIEKSIVEIKQSHMSRNELICCLNDLKEVIFDKLGMSLLQERKHDNNNYPCKLQDLNVKWKRLEPLLATNETVSCNENVEYNMGDFSTSSKRENDKEKSETNIVNSPIERVISIGTNNSYVDEFQMKSTEDNMQKCLNVKINDPTLSHVIDILDRHENTQSNSRENNNLLVTQATEELQSSNNKTDKEIKHNECEKEVLLGNICSIEKDKIKVESSFQTSYDIQSNNSQEKDFVISTVAKDSQTSYAETNIDTIHNSGDSNKLKETPLENIYSFEKLIETSFVESSVMVSPDVHQNCQKTDPTYNCKTSHHPESPSCIKTSTSSPNSSPSRNSQLLSQDSEQCIR